MAFLSNLKPIPRAIVIGAGVAAVVFGGNAILQKTGYLTPRATIASSVPDKIDISTETSTASSTVVTIKASSHEQIRGKILAWNATAGLIYANGGADTAKGSLMDQRGVSLNLKREDMYDKMIADLAANAKDPATGVHFVVIMGDGYPGFVNGANAAMKPFNQKVTAVGMLGFSRGEDKCVIAANAQAQGSLIAGVLGDGDINICIKYASDNGIVVNSDPKTYNPKAMNFTGVKEFTEADEKFISGACETRTSTETNKEVKICVNGTATWTPGDVKVAKAKAIKVLASTKDYPNQMPALVIGNVQWMAAHRDTVAAFLAAALEGGEKVRGSDDALKQAAVGMTQVFGEQDAVFWTKYHRGVVEMDKAGNQVFLGGSTTAGLGDNISYFQTKGLFQKVYNVYGAINLKYFPDTMPDGLLPYGGVVDMTYLNDLASKATTVSAPETVSFGGQTTANFASKSYAIEFETGKATFTGAAVKVLNDLLDQAAITNFEVQINGHTDNVGDPTSNIALSKARAEAVKSFLATNAPKLFPQERVTTRGFGDTQPVGDNKTAQGRSTNRRVEVILRK